MGHYLSRLVSSLGRFFEYPVKRHPICFYRQEDFTATASRTKSEFLTVDVCSAYLGTKRKREPKRRVSDVEEVPMTDYDKLVDLFYKRLAEQRQHNQEMKEQDRRWSIQKVVERFPGWNELTIANLHSLFLLFDNQSNGMLGFDDFCAVLESLGDETSMELRKEKFISADTDNDGWITYDEFLSLVYNFSPREEGAPGALARLCNEVADHIQFVSNLTVGEQLEYGLF